MARFDANQIKIPPYPGYTIDVKPFALEGAALEQWVQLLLDARLGAL
ncbi:MAG: hypothetical protein ABI467_17000 [Kofleriaceae bacterium]